jgi:Family of unknown function (DUF6263)
MKKTLFASSICILIAGWGIKLPSTAVNASSPVAVKQVSNTATNTARPSVELLNPGVQPRQALRLKPAANSKQTGTLTMKADTSISPPGQSAPTTVNSPTSTIKMETVVTKVDPNGDIHYQFSYTDVDVKTDTNMPPAAIEMMRSQLKKMIGFKGNIVLDNRGNTKDIKFTYPEGLDANLRQAIEQTSNSVAQTSSPLPEEAIGVGAKWRANSTVNSGALKLDQAITYELVDLKDNVATLTVNLEQQAAPQTITPAGAPPGMSMTIKSYRSQGQGQILLPLNQILPTRSNISARTNMQGSMKVPNNQSEVPMNTTVSMQMTIESQ